MMLACPALRSDLLSLCKYGDFTKNFRFPVYLWKLADLTKAGAYSYRATLSVVASLRMSLRGPHTLVSHSHFHLLEGTIKRQVNSLLSAYHVLGPVLGCGDLKGTQTDQISKFVADCKDPYRCLSNIRKIKLD